MNEFDFRMSNRVKLGVDDTMRTERAVKGVTGKRLTIISLTRPDTKAFHKARDKLRLILELLELTVRGTK